MMELATAGTCRDVDGLCEDFGIIKCVLCMCLEIIRRIIESKCTVQIRVWTLSLFRESFRSQEVF
jgi:hypothetical protein